MGYAFIDGFDDYPADVNAQGIGVAATWIGAANQELVPGRFGLRALRLQNRRRAVRGVDATDEIAVGFAVKFNDMAVHIASADPFLALLTPEGETQIEVGCDDIGRIVAKRGQNGAVIGECSKRVLAGTWHYIELELECADAGRLKLSIDGDSQIEYSGDTRALDGGIGRVALRACGTEFNNHSVDFDDVYMLVDDSTGKGESRAQLLTVTADADVQWDRLAGDSNASQVDEAQFDGDVSYNYSNTDGATDLFELSNLDGVPETIHAVQITLAAKKSDAGTRILKPVVDILGEDWEGPDNFQTTDYTWSRTILTANPTLALPWTAAAVGAMKVGYKLEL